MLYNILLFILCIFIPLFCVYCYRLGVKDGRNSVTPQEHEQEPAIPPEFLYSAHPPDAPRTVREQSKLDKLLHNIDNYNGTAEGQEEIN